MDARLHTILDLYSDPEASQVPATGAPPSATETRALREVTFALDHRPNARPDASTLDAIFAAAGGDAPVQPGLRRDRLPQPRARRPRRAAWVMAGLVSVACFAGAFVMTSGTSQNTMLIRGEMDRTVAPVALHEPAPLETESAQPRNLELGWNDDAQHLADVQREAHRLRARMDSLVWDADATDLSLGSPASGVKGIHAASARKR